MSAVPQYMSRHLASALTLLCRDKIDVLVDCGVLHDERGAGRWSRIPLHEIEAIRKRPRDRGRIPRGPLIPSRNPRPAAMPAEAELCRRMTT